MTKLGRGVWSTDEHDRFLDAIRLFPDGPWLEISKFIGTRSPRQVQTHAQKYYEKIERRLRGLRRDRQVTNGREHRIEKRILSLVSAESPEREFVKRHVAAVRRRPRVRAELISDLSGDDGHTSDESTQQDLATPPCLQRLRALPLTPLPLKLQEKETLSTIEEIDPTLVLPSFEQSLDFLIACLETGAQHELHMKRPGTGRITVASYEELVRSAVDSK